MFKLNKKRENYEKNEREVGDGVDRYPFGLQIKK